jgi:hypothetical protein
VDRTPNFIPLLPGAEAVTQDRRVGVIFQLVLPFSVCFIDTLQVYTSVLLLYEWIITYPVVSTLLPNTEVIYVL